jgi:hypothetical protein
MMDLQSADIGTATKAWDELERREKLGKLSSRRQSKLIDVCLKEQRGERTGTTLQWSMPLIELKNKMLDHIYGFYVSDRLPEKQRNIYLEQMIHCKLETRPKGYVGEKIPVMYSFRLRVGRKSEGFSARWSKANPCLLNGKPTEFGIGPSLRSQLVSSGSSVVCQTPGLHVVSLTQTIELYHGRSEGDPFAKVCYATTVPLKATIEAVAPSDGPLVKTVASPPPEEIKEMIELSKFIIRPLRERRLILAEVRTPPLPVNLAFEVFLRVGLKEYDAGKWCADSDGRGEVGSIGDWYEGPDVNSVDLILRSSRRVARRTVDLFEIWEGELVFEDVPVEIVAEGDR